MDARRRAVSLALAAAINDAKRWLASGVAIGELLETCLAQRAFQRGVRMTHDA